MQMEMVLTVMADDRPGIVEKLAEVIAAHDGNWVDSAMSRLGGEFAGILRITLDDSRAEALERALAALQQSDGIAVAVRKGAVSDARTGRAAYFEVVGQDHVGIVRDISRVLAENRVNVDELRTQVFTGSMTGQPMFSAEADIVLPDGLPLQELCEKLESVAGDLMVDIKLCGIRGSK
jgi:glycine cleavage system regulatory protein